MKYLYNTTRFVQYIDSPLAKYGLRLLTVYIPCRRITVTYGIPVHGLRVLKPWASPISEFYNLYPSFLFHSVLKILTVKANFQYLTFCISHTQQYVLCGATGPRTRDLCVQGRSVSQLYHDPIKSVFKLLPKTANFLTYDRIVNLNKQQNTLSLTYLFRDY